MRLFKQAGLQGVRTADWSEEVAPFWSAVIRSALSAQGLRGLLGAGWSTLKVPDFPRSHLTPSSSASSSSGLAFAM